jgi:predicted Holliday junction resolvase-like endonuclease
MDYVIFILIVLALALIIVFLNRTEKGIKARYKKTAYGLLETARPTSKEMKETIKGLRLYGGRWFKDKECNQLVQRLLAKWDTFEE